MRKIEQREEQREQDACSVYILRRIKMFLAEVSKKLLPT